MLVLAIILISLALILYSVGIWSNLIKKTVTKTALITQWTGSVFDISGNIAMILLFPGFSVNLHSILGLTVVGLMLIKAVTNTVFYVRNAGRDIAVVRIFGLVVWLLWVTEYFIGMSR